MEETRCTISWPDVAALALQAEREGFTHSGSRASRTKSFSPEFETYVEDLLTAILLHGGATYVGPEHAIQQSEVHALVEAGLLSFDTNDYSAQLRERAAWAYEAAFDGFRVYEGNRITASQVSLESMVRRPRPSHAESLEIAIAEANIDYGREFLEKDLGAIIGSLSTLVRGQFARETGLIEHALKDVHGNKRPTSPIPRQYSDQDGLIEQIGDLWGAMGLRKRGPEMYDLVLPVTDFTPRDLRKLWENDEVLFNQATLENASRARLLLGLIPNPTRFLKLHSYWRSFFGLMNVIYASNRRQSPAFLPFAGRPVLARQDEEVVPASQLSAIYRLYAGEIEDTPRIRSVTEVLKLQTHPSLEPLREVLHGWINSASKGDVPLLKQIRKDIRLARREFSRLSRVKRAGRYITFLALPDSIVYELRNSELRDSLSRIGSATDRWANLKLDRFSWMGFGKE